MWRLRMTALLGAAWTVYSVIVVKRRLRRDGLRATAPRAPRWDGHASRAVKGVLDRLEPTCLQRALVAQAWRAAHGDPRDVVIGVPHTGLRGAAAHAWLADTDAESARTHHELHRLPPPAQRH